MRYHRDPTRSLASREVAVLPMQRRNRGSRAKPSGYAPSASKGLRAVLNLTCRLQENILFGSPYDEARYNKGEGHMKRVSRVQSKCGAPVIKQCALERDLSLFEAGDQTEVGEKGITLRLVNRFGGAIQVFVLTSNRTLAAADRRHASRSLAPSIPLLRLCCSMM